jgi:O-antigen/teichoic acid export membrane protein
VNDAAVLGPAAPSPRGIARQSIGILFASAIGNAGFFIAALFLARSLGPSGRGVIAFFTVSALVGARVVGLGGSATSVFAAKYPGRRPAVLGTALSIALVTGVVGGALIAGILWLLRAHLPQGIDGPVLVLLALGILGSALMNVGLEFLRGCGSLRAYAWVIGLTPWVYAIGIAVLQLGPGIDVHRAAFIWTLYALGCAVASLVLSLRISRIAIPGRAFVREYVAFGVRSWAGSIAGVLNSRVDQVVMGFIATEAALGLYAVAVNVSEVLLYLPNATAAALLPAIMKGRADELERRTLSVLRRLTVLTGAGSLAAAVIGVPLIAVVFGSAFRGSILPFLILLPGGLGYGAVVVANTALLAVGKPQWASMPMVVALVLGLALDFLLIPFFDASGAAAAATIAFLAAGATGLVLFKHSCAFAWKETVPGRRDVAAVVWQVRSLIRPIARWAT